MADSPGTYEEIADALQAELLKVENIGNVFTFRRHIIKDDEFHDSFKDQDTGRTNGWQIHREPGEEERASSNDVITRRDRWIFQGFMGIKDSAHTSVIFQDVVDGIRARFSKHMTLNGLVEIVEPCQGNIMDDGIVKGRNVHFAELELTIQENWEVPQV